MTSDAHGPVISVMLAVPDAAAAARWYAPGLGATELWDLGGVVGLTVEGAPFFLGEPANNGWTLPHLLAQGRSGSRSSWTTPTASSNVRWQPERTAVSTRSAITRCHGACTAREASSTRSAISGLSVTGPRWAPARWPPGRWPGRSRGRPRSPAGTPAGSHRHPSAPGDVLPELAWSWRSLASAFVRRGVEVLQIAQGALSSRENAAVGWLRHRLNEGTCGGPTSVRQPWQQQRPRVQIQ
jgi:hypothetical protein